MTVFRCTRLYPWKTPFPDHPQIGHFWPEYGTSKQNEHRLEPQ